MAAEWNDPRTIEKVTRLLELLGEIDAAPDLEEKLVLHGGTALNLFWLDAPRLSVDIDLNYIGAVDLADVKRERPRVEERLTRIAKGLGYRVTLGREEHSGRTFKLRFVSEDGTDDLIKIDLSFLARVPLLPPERRGCRFDPGYRQTYPVMQIEEMCGGKTKALLERIAVRDLFDIHQMGKLGYPKSEAGKAILVYQYSMAAPFPFEIDAGRLERFTESDVSRDLLPMLRRGTECDLSLMKEEASKFIALPANLSEAHREYLAEFAGGDFRPKLLFGDMPEVLERAEMDPVAKWKLNNLRALLKGKS